MDRRPEISMTKHSKSEEWQSNMLGKEDSSYIRWDIGKCISNATDDYILKPGCLLDERVPLGMPGKETVANET
jgi:hypothetical protein